MAAGSYEDDGYPDDVSEEVRIEQMAGYVRGQTAQFAAWAAEMFPSDGSQAPALEVEPGSELVAFADEGDFSGHVVMHTLEATDKTTYGEQIWRVVGIFWSRKTGYLYEFQGADDYVSPDQYGVPALEPPTRIISCVPLGDDPRQDRTFQARFPQPYPHDFIEYEHQLQATIESLLPNVDPM